MAASALGLLQGERFTLGTAWSPAGSVTLQNEGTSLTASVSTLSPEPRGRAFTLEIGGTISGAIGVTVTIRQACVSFE